VDFSQPVFHSCGHQDLQLRKICRRLAADSGQVCRLETGVTPLNGEPCLAGVRNSGRVRAHLCHAVEQRTIDLLILLQTLLVRLGFVVLQCASAMLPKSQWCQQYVELMQLHCAACQATWLNG
jgi:hypothetical protein